MSPLPKVLLEPGDFPVVTLTEPWATLVVLGEKEWETRSWPTSFRGELLIQAAKSMPSWAQEAALREPFVSVLAKHGIEMPRVEDAGGARGARRFPFHFGSIIGAATLADTARTEAVAEQLRKLGTQRALNELAFGDYVEGRWAFRFTKPKRFAAPAFVRGSLGIWRLPKNTETAEQVRGQLEGPTPP